MEKTGIFIMSVSIFLSLLGSSCSGNKKNEANNNQDYIYGNWQVVPNSEDYENSDTLLFIINPTKSNKDGSFYNGIYESSYVMNDSVRATIIYDTIAGYRAHFHRMVAVTVNPASLNVVARMDSDSAVYNLHFIQEAPQYNVYGIKERTFMDILMTSGKTIYFSGLTPGGVNNSSAQSYSFWIDTKGFEEARQKCREFNANRPPSLWEKFAPTISEALLGF